MTPNAAPDAAPDATHRVERCAPGTDPAVTGPAVAVGSSHAVLTRDAALDFGLIAALVAALVAALIAAPVDTRRYLGPAREATTAEVARLLAVLNAAR